MAGTEVVYKAEFTDYMGNDCQIQVCQSGYAGSTTDVIASGNPCHISMLAEGDSKFQHVKTTECVVELMTQTNLQFLSLFLATNKTYFVRIQRGTTIIWVGWINPEFYTEPFDEPPYPTSITATDGLAELKNIQLPTISYTTFKHSLISYISTILQQTGFELGIKVGLNLSATTTADGTVTSRILEKLFIDYRAFRDGEDYWTCMEILEEILSTLNARVYQCDNYWIIDSIDRKHEACNYDVYTYAGVYDSAGNIDPVAALTTTANVGTMIRFLHTPATLEVQPAYKKFTIEHEWGNRKNILPFSNFEGALTDDDFTDDTTLRYWYSYPLSDYEALYEKVQLAEEKVLLMKPIPYEIGQVPSFTAFILPRESGSPASYFTWTYNEGSTNETAFMNWLYGIGTCRLKYECFANLTTYFESEPKLKSRVRLAADFSGNVYYCYFNADDTTEYEWAKYPDTPADFDLDHINTTLPKSEWKEIDVNIKMPPDELGVTQTYVGFMLQIDAPNLNEATIPTPGDGIYYKNIQLYFVDGTENDVLNKEPKESRVDKGSIPAPTFKETITHTIDTDNILEPDTYKIRFAESPAPFSTDGYGLINKYVLFDSGNYAVNLFGNGQTHTLSLVNQVLDSELYATYRRPQFKIRGTLMDTTISDAVGYSFMKVLKDYNYRYYFPTGLDYDVRMCQFSGEWMQFWEDSNASGTGEFNDDFSNDFFI